MERLNVLPNKWHNWERNQVFGCWLYCLSHRLEERPFICITGHNTLQISTSLSNKESATPSWVANGETTYQVTQYTWNNYLSQYFKYFSKVNEVTYLRHKVSFLTVSQESLLRGGSFWTESLKPHKFQWHGRFSKTWYSWAKSSQPLTRWSLQLRGTVIECPWRLLLGERGLQVSLDKSTS